MAIRVREVSVAPAQNTPTALITIPSGKMLPPQPIRINNTGSADYTFQCFRATAGATHAASQAVGSSQTVKAGDIQYYHFPEPCASGTIIRVTTNAPTGEMTFSLAAQLV